MVDEAVDLVVQAVVGWLDLCKQIFVATETTDLWIAGVLFVVCVSVLVLPLRGGQAIRENSFAGFLANRINSHKGKGNNRSRRTDHAK